MVATSALLAFVGYSILNLGQAGQKIGLEMRASRPIGGWLVWVAATLSTSVAFFVVFRAISIGEVSLVGAMAGTGLVSLAIFSRVVMNERLRPAQTVSVVAVAAGGVLAALAHVPSEGTGNIVVLSVMLGAGTIVYCVAWLATRTSPIAGSFLGGLSGFLGAFSQLFQEFANGDLPWNDGLAPVARAIVTDPVTIAWVVLSVVSMIVLQFAYRYGEATRIIPVFTGNFILVPVIGGMIAFSERVSFVQWIGVMMIVAGSVVLGARRKSDARPPTPLR